MQKVVNIKGKAGQVSSTIVSDLDVCCLRHHPLSHNTTSKMQIQGLNTKAKKSQTKKPNLAPSHNNTAEPAKKENKKNKKKKF